MHQPIGTRIPAVHTAARLVFGAALCLALAAPALSRAAVRPFVYGDLRWTDTKVQELDWDRGQPPDFMVWVPRNARGNWEAGGGARFFSRFGRNGQPQANPPWEFRLRFGLGRGSLPGKLIQGRINGGYAFTSHETYDYSNWTFGGTFLVNFLSRGGLFVGPVLQSISTNANRAWQGPSESECTECGDAKDQSIVRYSMLEVGARLKPFSLPLALEGYWMPKRFQLSTTHKIRSSNWTEANFPTYEHSIGARLTYDF